MDAKEFAKLCDGTAEMLQVLSKQVAASDGMPQFAASAADETIKPLLAIVTAINAAPKA